MSSEASFVTPKKEICLDVTPPTEDNEHSTLNSNISRNNKNRSTSLSSSSPTMSTVSSMSSNYLSLPSFKEPLENQERLYQSKRHSISFDFRDSSQKPNSQHSQYKNGTPINFRHSSQNLVYQNENSSSSTDSNINSNTNNNEKTKIYNPNQLKNKNNFFPIQNSSSLNRHLDAKSEIVQKRSKIFVYFVYF